MTSDFIQPPRIAFWLISLLIPAEEAESIPGDLIEEFSQIAAKSGVVFARRWFRRQTMRTIAYLLCSAFRAAPWSTTAAIGGGYLLRRFASRLPERAIFAVLERYLVFERHFNAYLFFASTAIDIGHLIVFLFVGCVVALAARGRELSATTLLGLIFGAMAVAGSLVMVTRTGDYSFLWRLTWHCADSFAVVIGGVIVRLHRSPTSTLPLPE